MGALRAIHSVQSGNSGESLSSADLLTYLYFKEMNVALQKRQKADRDRFVLSRSRCCISGLYTALATKSHVPTEDLSSPCLQLCPEKAGGLGADLFTAPKSQGLPIAAGMALATRYQERDCRIYTLLSVKETSGAWDMFPLDRHYMLDNLCVMIEQSGSRVSGKAENSLLPGKLYAMGLQVAEADGQKFESLEQAFMGAHESGGAPMVILVRTVMGKGRQLPGKPHGRKSS